MKRIALIITIIAAIWSCQKPDTRAVKNSQIENNYPERVLSVLVGEEIVDQYIVSKNISERSISSFLIEHISNFTYYDLNDLPAIYAYNYTIDIDTHFVLILADRNVYPIIAFGNGMFGEYNKPPGRDVWLNEQIELLEIVRDNNLSKEQFYELFPQPKPVDPPEDPCAGQNWSNTIGPLLSSEWGQGCYYNDKLNTGCTYNCNRKLTGCVATAMGQIMNYHEHPDNYDWTLILNEYNTTSTAAQIDEVATLMYDIGDAVDMDWGCSSSGASTCNDAPNAFKNTFGYTSAKNCVNYQYPQPIKTEINNSRPVIFRGVENGSGHAWVCDGYTEGNVCEVDEETGQVYSMSYLYFHLNWGWLGSQNGWYAYNNFGSYTSNQKVVLNINP